MIIFNIRNIIKLLDYFINVKKLDPLAKDKFKKDILFYAVELNYEIVADYLLKNYSILQNTSIDYKKNTPLFFSCRNGNLALTKQIIKAVKDPEFVNYLNVQKENCLFAALESRNIELIDFLLREAVILY